MESHTNDVLHNLYVRTTSDSSRMGIVEKANPSHLCLAVYSVGDTTTQTVNHDYDRPPVYLNLHTLWDFTHRSQNHG